MPILIVTMLFLLFGLIETVANLYYLIGKRGVELARRQHRELPADVSDRRMKIKIWTMLALGLLFLGGGIYACAAVYMVPAIMMGILMLFTVYMLAEALYYRQMIGLVFAALGAVMMLYLYAAGIR